VILILEEILFVTLMEGSSESNM